MKEAPNTNGWSTPETAALASRIRADRALHAAVLDRINGQVIADGFDEAASQAAAEVAAAWGGQFDVAPDLGGVDWQQLGEEFLLEVLNGDAGV